MNRLGLTLNARAAAQVAVAFVLSFVNLAGAMLALTVLGGLEPWSSAQVVGLFGVIELGMGLAFVFAPNVWRLPVAEAETSDRTEVRLAASTVLIPHWISFAKAAAGAGMVAYAGIMEGASVETVTVGVAGVLIGASFLALSAAIARFGAARPDLDVWYFSIRRAGGKEIALPGLSAGGVLMQVLSNFGVYPAAELLEPSALFGPELSVATEVLAGLAVATGTCAAAAWIAWRGRIRWQAPREQQREAEAELSART